MVELSKGSLDQIMSGRNFKNPVLQLLSYKKLRGATSDQYRLVVSDGERMNQYTMLSTKLNYLIENYILNIYTIFKLLNYEVTSMDKEGKVLIIMNCEVLTPAKEVMCMIGNPTVTNKPHSSTAVHHEVMEDTMQPSTSRDTNNSLRVEFTVPVITLEDTMQPSTSGDTNNFFHVESTVPIITLEDTMQPSISRDTNNSFRVESTVPIITLEDTMQPNTSRDTNNSFRVKSTVPIITLEDTMQPSTSRNTNNFSREEPTVPIKMKVTMQPSTSKDTNNSSRKEPTVPIKMKDTMLPSTSRDTNNFSREESTVPIEMEDTMLPSTSRDTNNFSRKEPTVPIKTLSPRKRGTIKARVINKSPIKEWKKNKRSGKWFSTDLVDNSDIIKCIVFKECNRFHNDLEDNKVYQISSYYLKETKQEFKKLQNKYEIELTKCTKIVECYDDGSIQLMPSAQLGGNFDAPLLTFQEAKAKLGENPNSENVFMVVATICSIYTYIYQACPNDSCKKKKLVEQFGIFKCDKCNKKYINFIYGLRLNIDISDSTGNCRVTAFNKVAENMFGMSIQALGELEKNDSDAYTEKIDKLKFKRYTFVLKRKAQTYTDEHTCESITPLKHLIYSKYLMAKVNRQS